MKAMTDPYKEIERGIGWLCGLTGGCLAYIKAHLLFTDMWGTFQDKALSLLWAGLVAFFSGAMGILGKRLIEKIFKKKQP